MNPTSDRQRTGTFRIDSLGETGKDVKKCCVTVVVREEQHAYLLLRLEVSSPQPPYLHLGKRSAPYQRLAPSRLEPSTTPTPSQSAMPSYKLIYFNGRGRAEVSRLLFALAGVDYEDVRMDSDSWQQFKPNTLLGQLPVLEVDGRQFTQSTALANYLAREFGFYGNSALEAFQIDEIIGIINDFFSHAIKVFFAEESKKEEAAKEFKTNQMPKFLKGLEKLLTKNEGKGFFIGKKVTLADVAVFDLCDSFSRRFDGMLADFPALTAHKEKMSNLDNLKIWLDKRPETQF